MVVHLYTDGSADNREGFRDGAWGYAIVDPLSNEAISERCGAELNTTNNRMELRAVLEGLRECDKNEPVVVYSDSAYLVNCFAQRWYEKWQANGWYATTGKVKNQDLWEALLAVIQARTAPIKWVHIRGHAGNYWNEHVDKMCTIERRKLKGEN